MRSPERNESLTLTEALHRAAVDWVRDHAVPATNSRDALILRALYLTLHATPEAEKDLRQLLDRHSWSRANYILERWRPGELETAWLNELRYLAYCIVTKRYDAGAAAQTLVKWLANALREQPTRLAQFNFTRVSDLADELATDYRDVADLSKACLVALGVKRTSRVWGDALRKSQRRAATKG